MIIIFFWALFLFSLFSYSQIFYSCPPYPFKYIASISSQITFSHFKNNFWPFNQFLSSILSALCATVWLYLFRIFNFWVIVFFSRLQFLIWIYISFVLFALLCELFKKHVQSLAEKVWLLLSLFCVLCFYSWWSMLDFPDPQNQVILELWDVLKNKLKFLNSGTHTLHFCKEGMRKEMNLHLTYA